ncbi:hypothetical protein JNW90_26455 [Micromonospora sp. STR1s_5]|nr:hypothetical protein [Micromonospora sp. STR1s_5]
MITEDPHRRRVPHRSGAALYAAMLHESYRNLLDQHLPTRLQDLAEELVSPAGPAGDLARRRSSGS